jgi:dGTPase
VSMNLDWAKLLSTDRLSDPDRKKVIESSINDHRIPHERDYDRAVFCAPVRRLKDKTQVFPLDMHDGVRTRLTHSLEVSNLARSMGVAVASKIEGMRQVPESLRSVPALLATIALTHDLGNPPFGHQGEVAIRSWVDGNTDWIKEQSSGEFGRGLLTDFLSFEGNAQGLRILARLQYQNHNAGLRLTASTLRAFMKYPWSSALVGTEGGPKKFGYFQSEKDIFKWASEHTGLPEKTRHPLSYLMEVCDDIAYSVLDVEDAVKKELISAADFASFIGSGADYKGDERVEELLNYYNAESEYLNDQRMPAAFPADKGKPLPLSAREIRDSQIETLRSYAIGLMVSDAIERFIELERDNSFDSLEKGIAESCRSTALISAFKDFGALRIYKHPTVIRAELQGHHLIPRLMNAFYGSVVAHGKGRPTKINEYVMSLISPNYIRVFRHSTLPVWYKQVQLVCDQVCGMTDSFAVRTYKELEALGAL